MADDLDELISLGNVQPVAKVRGRPRRGARQQQQQQQQLVLADAEPEVQDLVELAAIAAAPPRRESSGLGNMPSKLGLGRQPNDWRRRLQMRMLSGAGQRRPSRSWFRPVTRWPQLSALLPSRPRWTIDGVWLSRNWLWHPPCEVQLGGQR